MDHFKRIDLVILLLLLSQGTVALADVSLPALVSSGMVLQQNSEIRIWGWADPLEEVEVTCSWSGETRKTISDSHANWEVTVRTTVAGGPYEVLIRGYNTIKLVNVMIGEVWICSAQSNMQMSPASGVNRAQEEIGRANFPNIRLFNLVRRSASDPQLDLTGTWRMCEPETMQDFSAVGYYFSKIIHEKLEVPVGIINASWGGTPAEAWIPASSFAESDSLNMSSACLTPKKWGPQKPSVVFNAMISPMEKLKIAGVIWYQGEDNTLNPEYYKTVFGELVRSWRSFWQLDLPFYYVQIAPFSYGLPEQGVLVREAQRRSLTIPKTKMVVTSDIGDINDIHPKEKFEIGRRLGNIALKHHYHVMDSLVESPEFVDYEIDGNRILLRFDHAEGLYFKSAGGELFEIAGEDGVFYPAKARIRNKARGQGGVKGVKGEEAEEAVEVKSKQVKNPKYVRFAWGNTRISNLFNRANLPASSFTTLILPFGGE